MSQSSEVPKTDLLSPMTYPPKRKSSKKSSKMETEPKLRQEKLVNVGQHPDTEVMVTVTLDTEAMVTEATDINTMPPVWITTLLNTITVSACGIWHTKIMLSRTPTLVICTTRSIMMKYLT